MLIATKKEMTIFIFPFNSSSTASSTRCPHIRYLRAIHCSALLFLSIRRSTHIILDLFYFFYFKNTSGGSVSVLILHISRPNKVRWSSTTQTYPEWYTQLNAVHIFYKNGLIYFPGRLLQFSNVIKTSKYSNFKMEMWWTWSLLIVTVSVDGSGTGYSYTTLSSTTTSSTTTSTSDAPEFTPEFTPGGHNNEKMTFCERRNAIENKNGACACVSRSGSKAYCKEGTPNTCFSNRVGGTSAFYNRSECGQCECKLGERKYRSCLSAVSFISLLSFNCASCAHESGRCGASHCCKDAEIACCSSLYIYKDVCEAMWQLY